MSPLRDTVRFIHRQQYRIPVRQMIKKVVQHQAFRRNIQQTNLSGTAPRHHLKLLLAALSGVQARRRHTVRQ